MAERTMLLVTLDENIGAAHVECNVHDLAEATNTFGVVAQHILSMFSGPEVASMLHVALDEAERRGGLGRFRVVEANDD